MAVEIKTYGGHVLYVSKSAKTNKEAVEEAATAGAYLTGANLDGAYLTGAYLTGANLTRAYLTGANLTGAYLTGAYLTGANLTRANLTRANLTGANLDGANLTGAYLTGANLDGAYLTGANLDGANLDGANLTRATGLDWVGVADALKQAIASMNDGGKHWTKGTLERVLDDGSKAYCAIGGVSACSSGNTKTLALWLVGSVAAGDIAAFNDHAETTWDDVQAVFAVAIRHAERLAK